jgi:hypothetical protein
MARKIKTISKCPMCKTNFNTKGYTIRQGTLQGVFVVDESFCGEDCSEKFKILLNKHRTTSKETNPQ